MLKQFNASLLYRNTLLDSHLKTKLRRSSSSSDRESATDESKKSKRKRTSEVGWRRLSLIREQPHVSLSGSETETETETEINSRRMLAAPNAVLGEGKRRRRWQLISGGWHRDSVERESPLWSTHKSMILKESGRDSSLGAANHREYQIVQEKYKDLTKGRGPLTSEDVSQMLELLRGPSFSRLQPEETEQKIHTVISLYKNGSLPASRKFCSNIVAYFRDTAQWQDGKNWWDWLKKQDQKHLSLSSYANIIQIELTTSNLATCEELFKEGIENFCDSDTKRLVSPNARFGVICSPYPSFVPELSLLIIRMIDVRLAHKDPTAAFLALDTVLRVGETRAQDRILGHFIRNQPVYQSYIALCMLCQSRSAVHPSDTIPLLGQMPRIRRKGLPSTLECVALMALSTIHQVLAERGSILTSAEFGHFMFSILTIDPMLPPSAETSLRKKVQDTSLKLSESVTFLGKTLKIGWYDGNFLSTFLRSFTINRDGNLYGCLAREIDRSAIFTEMHWIRTALISAGMMGNTNDLKKWWYAATQQPSFKRNLYAWEWLAEAAGRSDDIDFLKKELSENLINRDEDGAWRRTLRQSAYEWRDCQRKEIERAMIMFNASRVEEYIETAQRLIEAMDRLRELVDSDQISVLRSTPPIDIPFFRLDQTEPWEDELYTEVMGETPSGKVVDR